MTSCVLDRAVLLLILILCAKYMQKEALNVLCMMACFAQ